MAVSLMVSSHFVFTLVFTEIASGVRDARNQRGKIAHAAVAERRAANDDRGGLVRVERRRQRRRGVSEPNAFRTERARAPGGGRGWEGRSVRDHSLRK